MTNADRVLAAVRANPGLTDAELRRLTRVEPHQQVNQICRRLEAAGLLRRVLGPDGHIVNLAPAGPTAPGPHPVGSAPCTAAVSTPKPTPSSPPTLSQLDRYGTLVVVPCSARKTSGGGHAQSPSVLAVLPDYLAEGLRAARSVVGRSAGLDETLMLPAWQRYAGTFYQAGGASLGAAVGGGVPAVILSGGYGIALAAEPVGRYDRRFALSDWPSGLLEECLVAVAQQVGARNVVAFCSRTTGYADLLRRVRWSSKGIDAWLAGAVMGHRGGAQVLAPRASGQALSAFLDGRLVPGWQSSDGITIDTERLS